MTRPIARRGLLQGAAALALPAVAGAAPASLPAHPALLVAGPSNSPAGRWAEVVAAPLGQSMGGEALGLDNVGGADGVTGVNQFQARTVPDGATALMLPGTALLTALAGDTRARFNAGSWAPLWGASLPASVATRVPLTAGRRVRIAADGLVGPVLEALLALHMMEVDAVLVPRTDADPLQQRDVDVVYLRGAASPERLAAGGWRPAFALVAPGPRRPLDPMSSDSLPSELVPAHELFTPSRMADPALNEAFRAVCAAAALDVALVMPAVAPAAVLAWWRRGCEQLDDQPAVRAAAAAAGVRQDDAGFVATQLSFVTLDMAASLALRSLLAERYGWRPV